MPTQAIDNNSIINELRFGSGISHAIKQGRRADFALLMSMFSNDVRDSTPVEPVENKTTTDEQLRLEFELAPPQELRSSYETFSLSYIHAQAFHRANLPSAKLSHYLKPDALAYMPEKTGNLPEEVYQNLSPHEQRRLHHGSDKKPMSIRLYQKLNSAFRQDQLHVQR